MVAMRDRTTYTAHCVRSNGWWAISVPEIPGVHTQARRLDQVDAMVREAIALFLDAPEDSFDIAVAPELPDELEQAIAELRRRKEEAEIAHRAAGEASVAVASALVAAGLTVRDVGQLLGVSYQRIAQLLSPPRGRGDIDQGARSLSRRTRSAAGAAK